MNRVKNHFAALFLISVFLSTSSLLFAEPMQCEVGPVEKSFGGTKWTVYSCDDKKSLVIVSADGNPAMPYFFMISEIDGKLAIHGEGNGSKEASTAAGRDLEKLMVSENEIAALIAETLAVSKGETRK